MKKKDMNALIEGLRKVSEDFSLLADALEGVESNPGKVSADTEAPENTEAPVTEHADVKETDEGTPETDNIAAAPPAYSFEQVRGILAEKSRSGHREKVKAMIARHGGVQLSDFKDKPDILTEMAKEAEGF